MTGESGTTTNRIKKMKYIVTGSVRGTISRHNTLCAAIRSMRKDQRDCRSIGGGAYSDVSIERADGEDLTDSEIEEIQSAE